MAIMGRPRKEINQKDFERLCGIQCTKEEIAAWFDMDIQTLEARIKEIYGETFSQVFAKKRGKGKISLRRNQWRLSEKNAAMAIFLGKQFLGQSDKIEQEHHGEIKLAYNLDNDPDQLDPESN